MTERLTGIFRAVTLYDLSKLHVASNYCYLVGGLVSIVECIALTAPKQKQTCAALLAVHSTDMQWSITRCIACIHVCSIEQQLLKMLHKSIPTCLRTNSKHQPLGMRTALEQLHIQQTLLKQIA
jgi:hypothetical protein